MGLNIKNETVEKLAEELATYTGRSKTAAIQFALEQALERVKQDDDVAERRRRIREIINAAGPFPEGVTSDHSDFYDEWGLPK